MNQKQIANLVARYCKRTRESFFTQYSEFVHENAEGERYIYIRRGGNVLAVAHLDSVVENGRAVVSIDNKTQDYVVTSYALDDRLGVCALIDLLPSFGFSNYDILLTDNEEKCRSTAFNFKTDATYNWIFELDRRSANAAVLYDYEDDAIVAKLNECGIKIEQGSYSDICDLESLNVIGVNFSCGYNSEHSAKCAALIEDVISSIRGIVMFCNKYQNEHMGFVPQEYTTLRSLNDKLNTFVHDDRFDPSQWNESDVLVHCISCGYEFDEFDIDLNGFCPDCGDWMMAHNLK